MDPRPPSGTVRSRVTVSIRPPSVSRSFSTKIFDRMFAWSRSRVERPCRGLLDRGIRVAWEREIRVGSVDRSFRELMQQAGSYYVGVGIESGGRRVLDTGICKKIRLSDTEELLA